MSAQLWVIGAGKGGVGKTFVSSSLGITLAKLNYRVLVVDFDFSGANLHTCFGESPSKKNISSYFSKNQPLSELVQATRIPKLSLIQGFWDSWAPTEISLDQVRAVVESCRQLPFDYVLFDLGAGVTAAHLELFHQADERILISTAEPTSVEKNYRFVESFIFYSLKDCATADSIVALESALRTYRATHKKGFFSFREHLAKSVGINFDFFEKIQAKPLRLIINESRSRLDEDLGQSIKSVCHKYYDLPVDAAGCIDFDNAVWQSVKSREPILIEKPFTPLAAQFLMICKHLTNPNFHANFYRAVV